ncbi:dihydroxyacetone kinase family protein [Embleya sp. NPDC050493]|uniref:dihydroxyacetone kinase family protein n=1 Tax=Embleya sp. NPDC050493 TaxID=3363989 RepID=UPI0037B1D9D2
MKKLINAARDVVPEMLEGLALAHPDIALLADANVALRADARAHAERGRVAVISGGGAGHEPAHAGYVGPGMLTAAVSGDVFTSPSTDTILAAIRTVAGPAGVLLVVKSYTGDRLNFGLAAELARAEGIAVETVVVADDVALASGDDTAGRRGIAGTVFVHKVAGAAAESGASLAEVKAEAEAAAGAVGTMGVALTPCTVPAAGRPGFELGEDEVELGLGIHGEAGVRRDKIASADTFVTELLDRIVAETGLAAGDRVALLVNNLGGTPTMELDIVLRGAVRDLAGRGLVLERAWRGSFLTALEMAGMSLSLLRVDDARLARLDAATSAPAWPTPVAGRLGEVTVLPAAPAPGSADAGTPLTEPTPLTRAIEAVCAALTEAEPRLTELDRIVGDGDLGISLARGAEAIGRELPGYGGGSPAAVLRGLADTVRRALGGTSGPLYSVLLLRAASAVAQDTGPRGWREALAAGARAIGELGGAQVGDRTMLDALVPAGEALVGGASLAEAIDAAAAGTEETAGRSARRGRSSYLGDRAIGTVDPGAEAVVIWLRAIAESLDGEAERA